MKKYKILTTVTFCVYIALITWIIVFKFGAAVTEPVMYRTRSLNLIPFTNTGGIGDIMDNLLLFVPFGLFLRMKNKEHFLINALIMLGTSVIFEAVQYAIAIGVCDVTDVITNTAGGLVGYGVTCLIYRIFKNEDKTSRWLAIVSSVAIFCAAAFIGFLSAMALFLEINSGI